jgi:hypothetical protein
MCPEISGVATGYVLAGLQPAYLFAYSEDLHYSYDF